MEIEGALASLKWLWSAVFLPFLLWIFKRQDSLEEKVNNRYTKTETNDAIDLRVDPLKTAVENNTEICKELSVAITELRIELVKIRHQNDNGQGD